MKSFYKKIQPYVKIIVIVLVVLFFSLLGYSLYTAPVQGLEDKFIYLLEKYGYVILFGWSILEGETGLIMAGLLAHAGHMNLYLAVFFAGIGAFCGDQLYFYIGRMNKNYVFSKLKGQRRKFALANLLLQKYGWPIIFFQRYMYGMRTIIPISIGLTRYNAIKFAIINLISSWCWAAITIIPVWYFGEEILDILHIAKDYWYVVLPFGLLFGGLIIYYFHTVTKKKDKRGKNENKVN